ncbi:hypothetical protein ACLOJK_010339 [Asimina triloba]
MLLEKLISLLQKNDTYKNYRLFVSSWPSLRKKATRASENVSKDAQAPDCRWPVPAGNLLSPRVSVARPRKHSLFSSSYRRLSSLDLSIEESFSSFTRTRKLQPSMQWKCPKDDESHFGDGKTVLDGLDISDIMTKRR